MFNFKGFFKLKLGYISIIISRMNNGSLKLVTIHRSQVKHDALLFVPYFSIIQFLKRCRLNCIHTQMKPEVVVL